MRVLVVNPNTSDDITRVIGEVARRAAGLGTEIVVVAAPFGPRYIATRSENAIAAHATLAALAAYAPGCDGAVIAAFTDPGLFAARELLPVPVVGMAEAAMLTACLLGGQFAILTITDRLAPILREVAETYGLGSRLASVRTIEHPAIDVARDPAAAMERLAGLGRAAISEDGAEVLILGGAPLGTLDRALAERLEMPVIEGIGCAVRLAEMLVRLGARKPRAGSFSRPPAKDMVGVSAELARLFQPAPAGG